MIEVVLTLGGFLGVIISLQQDTLPKEARPLFSVFIVLFIVFAFFAYSAVSIPLEEKAIRFFLGAFSAVFSGLLVLALSIPLSSASVGIVIQSSPYIGVLGAVIVYLVFVLVFAYLFYFLMSRAIMLSLKKMEPTHKPQEDGDVKKEDLHALKEALRLEVRKILADYQSGREAETRGGRTQTPSRLAKLGGFRSRHTCSFKCQNACDHLAAVS